MSYGDLRYVADSFLIDKLFLIDAGINKKASAADGLLGSIAGSIMDWGKEHIDTSAGASSIVSSLADLLVPGVLFKINPMLGGLAAVADALGFSPISVVKKIIQFVQQKLESGTLPTLEEVNSIGKSAVSGEAGPMLVEANADMLDLLHEVENRGQLFRLVRKAQYRGGQNLPEIPFFGGKGGVIERIFGQLFKLRAKNKAKWLLGGFVVWIVKTVLLGAGLIAGAEKVVSLLGGDEAKPSNANELMTVNNHDDTPIQAPLIENRSLGNSLTPTGRGQDIHTNDHKTSTWVVPMVGGSVENTLLAWAADIYKELAGQGAIIATTESFNKTVEQMSKGLDSSKSNQLTVPAQFKSRKQIVDQFASEVAYKI